MQCSYASLLSFFYIYIKNRRMTYLIILISLVLNTQGSNHSLSRSLLFNCLSEFKFETGEGEEF